MQFYHNNNQTYTTVEYASSLWHPTLTKSQDERLEAAQRSAINIIFVIPRLPHASALAVAGIPSLQARRLDLSKRFFRNICNPIVVYRPYHILPLLRDPAVTSRLRKPTV